MSEANPYKTPGQPNLEVGSRAWWRTLVHWFLGRTAEDVEEDAYWAILAERPRLSDAEFAARFYPDLPPSIPTRVRQMYAEALGYDVRGILPSDDVSARTGFDFVCIFWRVQAASGHKISRREFEELTDGTFDSIVKIMARYTPPAPSAG